jgi:hypothetical protein
VNYEWKDGIDILINPPGDYYLNHFIKPWDEAICDKQLAKRSLTREIGATIHAMYDIVRSVTRNKLAKENY